MKRNESSRALTRRDFIRRAACAAVGTAALSATVRDLRIMNAAALGSALPGYKALVCVFLAGGNDSNNMIVPTTPAEYGQYAAARSPALALPLAGPGSLLPISPLNSGGQSYGFHPACPELQALFGEGKLAVVFNAGTLAFPLTRAQYLSGSAAVPLQLFSHADQAAQWQTSIPDRPSPTGWGGRCADLLSSLQPGAPISLSVSLAGINTFEVGNVVSQYVVSSSGAVSLTGMSASRLQALTNILALPYQNLQAQAYAKVAERSLDAAAVLNGAIASTNGSYWNTPFPQTITSPTDGTSFASQLGPQLQMAARLIEAGRRAQGQGGFGLSRQIFFCSVGGYDLHTSQTNGPEAAASGAHANLLAELSQSLFAFQRAMEQLGVSDSIATFTASDFGRTLTFNGSGTDHGWGSHHLVLGGPVNGQRTYGVFPILALGSPDDTFSGRWIPTIATDQYFATLASWFGVSGTDLNTVFPNLGRFASHNLGFI